VMNALSNLKIRFEMKPQSAAAAATSPVAGGAGAGVGDTEQATRKLRERWQASVAPHAEALRDAAKTHNEVIAGLRKEQQRLIDEADRIQRVIDELEKKYQDLTTPQTQQ
jgi:hypothetical protein